MSTAAQIEKQMKQTIERQRKIQLEQDTLDKQRLERQQQAEAFLSSRDIYVVGGVQSQTFFWEYRYDQWDTVSEHNFKMHNMEFKDAMAYQALLEAMKSRQRTFTKVTYAFGSVPPNTLNLVRRDAFVQPLNDGQPHNVLFDVLLKSLANGDLQKTTYLEHTIAWKYLNVDTLCQQCIVWYGEGGAGKGILVDVVLNRMFGGLTISSIWEELGGGSFNSGIGGKVCVMFNELPKDKADMNRLKNMIGKTTMSINEKYMPRIEMDNHALYFIASNDTNGPITLGRDKSDRRWVIMKIEHNLNYWLNAGLDLGLGDMENLPTEVMAMFRDENEIGRWLHYLIAKHGQKGAPDYVQTADFIELKEDQKDPWEELFEEVFSAVTNESQISCEALYKRYRVKMDDQNPSGTPMGQKTLTSRAKAFNTRHNTGWNKKVIRDGGETMQGFARDDYGRGCSVGAPSSSLRGRIAGLMGQR